MADGLILSRLQNAYVAASPAAKLLGWGLLLLVLVLPPAFFWRSGHEPAYRALFAELSDRDGGEVIAALEQLRIPYRISQASGAIEVPAAQWQLARYRLAAQGLPRGDRPAGDEVSGPQFGLSPFQEQVGYQRGLEAELARSVESIEGVASARVHLALPKQSAFLREQVPPAASVLLRLKPGRQLREDQVEALRQIVAGGVAGLHGSQVSIVDQNGALLAAGLSGVYRGLSQDQLEAVRGVENDLAKRITDVLAPVLGGTPFKVQVTARLDFSAAGADKEGMGSLRQVSVLVIVDERANQGGMAPDKLAELARQAIAFDSARGDSLQVIALPFQSAEVPKPAAEPAPKHRPEKAAAAAADAANLPIYAGLAAALAVLVLLLYWRARQRMKLAREAELSDSEPEPGEAFEARVEALRQAVLSDPRLAASVVKLWVQAPADREPAA